MAGEPVRRGPRRSRRAGSGRRQLLEYRWRVHSLWLVPSACIAAGAIAAAVTLAIDAAVGYDAVPHHALGTPSAVQTILSTAASAMLTLTTIVLTVLTLGVQLAMQQFSPRIVRALLADARSQLAHGLFAASFLYCMVAVAAVDDSGSPGHQVPTVTVAVAYLLLLTSLVVLVGYVHHAGQSLRVAGLVDVVGDNLQHELERSFPVETAIAPDPAAVTAVESGVVVMLDLPALVAEARRVEDSLELAVAVGDFVPVGGLIARYRAGGHGEADRVRRAVVFDNERSHVGDAAYGFRKLVDIVGRSLASGPHDDPVTAVQAIDRIHDGMRQLSVRRLPTDHHHDETGALRVVTRELGWSGYVAVAFDEVVTMAASSPLVARRLLAAFDDLLTVAPAPRRPALEARRQRLIDDADRGAVPLRPDVQGLGSSEDLQVRR